MDKKLEVNQFRIDHRRHPDKGAQDLIDLENTNHLSQQLQIVDKSNSNNLKAAINIYTLGMALAGLFLLAEIILSKLSGERFNPARANQRPCIHNWSLFTFR